MMHGAFRIACTTGHEPARDLCRPECHAVIAETMTARDPHNACQPARWLADAERRRARRVAEDAALDQEIAAARSAHDELMRDAVDELATLSLDNV